LLLSFGPEPAYMLQNAFTQMNVFWSQNLIKPPYWFSWHDSRVSAEATSVLTETPVRQAILHRREVVVQVPCNIVLGKAIVIRDDGEQDDIPCYLWPIRCVESMYLDVDRPMIATSVSQHVKSRRRQASRC
jgi:hypothetical protein